MALGSTEPLTEMSTRYYFALRDITAHPHSRWQHCARGVTLTKVD
jgi:hypothetical protein